MNFFTSGAISVSICIFILAFICFPIPSSAL